MVIAGMSGVDAFADVGSASLVAVWLARHHFDCRIKGGQRKLAGGGFDPADGII